MYQCHHTIPLDPASRAVWRAGGCFPLTGVLGVRPPQRTASVYTFFQDLRNTLFIGRVA